MLNELEVFARDLIELDVTVIYLVGIALDPWQVAVLQLQIAKRSRCVLRTLREGS